MLGVMLISCATAFSWFVRQQVRGTGRERILLTNRSLAQVLTTAVMNLMYEVSTKVKYDSPTQKWFQPLVIPVDNSEVWMIKVTPLDDKIPLRNLFLPDGNTLRRELTDIWHNMLDKLNCTALENILLDFFDRNNRPRVGSVELDTFINRGPYDISELLILSKDIPYELIYSSEGSIGFDDYCTVFSDGQFNLNVAPLHVMELLPGLDVTGLAARVEQVRREKALTSMQDIASLPGASSKTSTMLTNIACFKSRYFQLDIQCISMEGEDGTSFEIVFDRTTRKVVRWEES